MIETRIKKTKKKVMLVNHGPLQQSSKGEYEPWK